ncbi:MAG: tetratricopeptide repeat protein [Cyanobacteria bacterium SZAS LIN-3]|nr:tetratricopeptide repeat protein [Cyanobacteria bacterium SZAS LIN-3]
MRRHLTLLLLIAISSSTPAQARGEEYCKLLMHGAAEYDAARYPQAETLLNQAVAQQPNNIVCRIERGRCLWRLGKFNQAISDFDTALKLHPNRNLTIQTLTFRVTANQSLKNWPAVISDCNKLLQLEEHDAFACAQRAMAYDRLGKRSLAQKDYDQCHRLVPRNKSYLAVQRLIDAEADVQDKFAAGIKYLDGHIRAHPYDADAYYTRAGLYSQLGKPKETMADYDASIKLSPVRFMVQYQRAKYLASQKLYKQAVEGFTDALEQAPGNDHVLLERAESYAKMGDYARSISDYSAMAALHPQEEDPLHFRARVYALDKQYERALSDYNTVIKLAPEQAANYKERADIYERLGRREMAVRDRKKAAELLAAPVN